MFRGQVLDGLTPPTSFVPVTSQPGGNECGLQHDALSSFWDGQQPTSAEFQTAAIRRNIAATLGEAATKGDGSAPSRDTETRLSVFDDTLCYSSNHRHFIIILLLKYNQVKHSSKYINMSRTYQARTCTYGSPVKVCAQSKYK